MNTLAHNFVNAILIGPGATLTLIVICCDYADASLLEEISRTRIVCENVYS